MLDQTPSLEMFKVILRDTIYWVGFEGSMEYMRVESRNLMRPVPFRGYVGSCTRKLPYTRDTHV